MVDFTTAFGWFDVAGHIVALVILVRAGERVAEFDDMRALGWPVRFPTIAAIEIALALVIIFVINFFYYK